MMESLLKKSYGITEKKGDERHTLTRETFEVKRSANCNICRNFSNIFDRSHRLSTSHQNKLTARFKIIRSKMKMIKYDSISVHDDQWRSSDDDLWCYFCDKSVKKHELFDGVAVQDLGYLIHLTDSQHIGAVKSYLKYHGRQEKFELFCKTKTDLQKFLDKIPEMKRKYLAKMHFIDLKDVEQIKQIEAERQLLIYGALEVPVKTVDRNQPSTSGNRSTPQASTLHQKISHKRIANLNQKPCPWLVESKESNDHTQQVPGQPVIGPTIDTLKKHVADQKKKMLPVKRLGANFQRKKIYSSHWLPSFSGVWNKGRQRQMKSNVKNTE